MATEGQCFNPEKVVHVGTDRKLCNVVANELGRRVPLCGECVNYYTSCKRCDLCDALCFGPTLEIEDGKTPLKSCSLGSEVYCYECVGEQLPKFMSEYFTKHPEAAEQVFAEYYDINEQRLDFSTPDTIELEWKGKKYRRGMEKGMCGIPYAMYEISMYAPAVGKFLRELFIPKMRARRYKECCYVQTIRSQRVTEGLETVAHFIPLSRGHPRAAELLPSRYVRAGTPHILRRIREQDDFGSFLDFLHDN